MPKVSVIVPIYKVEPYIERCVRSLFEQTLDDIEYVFVDDFTPDRSIDILMELIEAYPERKSMVKVLRNPQNLGLPRTRRRGFEVATGEYIVSCDSDDWTDVTMYEKMYRKAVEGNYDMVWCDCYHSDGVRHRVVPHSSSEDKYVMIGNILSGRIMGTVWNRMFRTSFLRTDDFIFPTDDMIEDVVFTVQTTLLSTKIGHVEEPLYYYFFNADSISRTKHPERILKNHRALVKNTAIVEQVLTRYGLTARYRAELDYKKCINKEVLLPLLGERGYRRLWMDTNSEINGRIWKNPLIPRYAKIRWLCFHYRLTPVYLLWKRFKGC